MVEPDELTRAARTIGGLPARFSADSMVSFGMAVEEREVGHPALAEAIAEFQDASRHAAAALAGTAEATAARLTGTAAAYVAADREAARAISAAVGRGHGG